MNYKTVLSTDASVCERSADTTFKTYEEVIADFNALTQQRQCEVQKHKQLQSPPLPNSVQEALATVHDSLKSYWPQFGIMDKSTYGTFYNWAKTNMSFKENRTRTGASLQPVLQQNDDSQ